MSDKAERGMKIYATLPGWFNVYPVLTYDQHGCPTIDYEALADWFDAKAEKAQDEH